MRVYCTFTAHFHPDSISRTDLSGWLVVFLVRCQLKTHFLHHYQLLSPALRTHPRTLCAAQSWTLAATYIMFVASTQRPPHFPRKINTLTNFLSTIVTGWRKDDGKQQLRDELLCHAVTQQNYPQQTRKIWGVKSWVESGTFEIRVYLWIFPRVLPATALNLSGRISILAASWPGRCWCPARPPVLPERALSPSLPLSSLPTLSSLNREV